MRKNRLLRDFSGFDYIPCMLAPLPSHSTAPDNGIATVLIDDSDLIQRARAIAQSTGESPADVLRLALEKGFGAISPGTPPLEKARR
jgi:hypothetical protein